MAKFSYTKGSELAADLEENTRIYGTVGEVKAIRIENKSSELDGFIILEIQQYDGWFKRFFKQYLFKESEFKTLEFRKNLRELIVYVDINEDGDETDFDTLRDLAFTLPFGFSVVNADYASDSNVVNTYTSTGGSTNFGSLTTKQVVFDDVTLVGGEDLLLKDQTDAKQNGIWNVETIRDMWRPSFSYTTGDYVTAGLPTVYEALTDHTSTNDFAVDAVDDNWMPDTAYITGDYVIESGSTYEANTDHTSSALFATDAANWDLIDPWVGGSGYLIGDKVEFSLGVYIAQTNHTATGDFATDLANGDWTLDQQLNDVLKWTPILNWVASTPTVTQSYTTGDKVKVDNVVYIAASDHDSSVIADFAADVEAGYWTVDREIFDTDIWERVADFSGDISANILSEIASGTEAGNVFEFDTALQTLRVGGLHGVNITIALSTYDLTDAANIETAQTEYQALIDKADDLESNGWFPYWFD